MDMLTPQRKKVSPLLILPICIALLVVGFFVGLLVNKSSIFSKEGPSRKNETTPNLQPILKKDLSTKEPLVVFAPPLLFPVSMPPASSVGEIALCIQVLDLQQKPVPFVDVFATTLPIGTWPRRLVSSDVSAKGDLGVLQRPLPYPEEVIQGAVLKHSSSIPSSDQVKAVTDSQGLARFSTLPGGVVLLFARKDGLFAETVVRSSKLQNKSSTPSCNQETVQLILFFAPESEFPQNGGAVCLENKQKSWMLKRRDVSIEVMDESGVKIKDVLVTAKGADENISCKTDDKGKCLLGQIPIADLQISTEHATFAPFLKDYKEEEIESLTVLRISLSKGIPLGGHVRDVSGRPIQGAIHLSLVHRGVSLPILVQQAGVFQIPNAPIGEVSLQVQAPGYVPMEKKLRIEPSRSVDEVRIEMVRAGQLRGKIKSESGGILGSLKVRFYRKQGELVGHAVSNEQGEFFVKDVPPGDLMIEVKGTKTFVQVYSDHEQWVELQIP